MFFLPPPCLKEINQPFYGHFNPEPYLFCLSAFTRIPATRIIGPFSFLNLPRINLSQRIM